MIYLFILHSYPCQSVANEITRDGLVVDIKLLQTTVFIY